MSSWCVGVSVRSTIGWDDWGIIDEEGWGIAVEGIWGASEEGSWGAVNAVSGWDDGRRVALVTMDMVEVAIGRVGGIVA